jgi:hypothetical protein
VIVSMTTGSVAGPLALSLALSLAGPLAGGDPGPSFTAIVESAARAAADLVGDAAHWWQQPSGTLLSPAVLGAHQTLRPVLVLVLTASVLVQSIRIIALRRGEPLFAVLGGLVRFAVAAALGITVLQGALWAGDVLAGTLLGTSAADFGTTMRDALTARRGDLAEPFLLLVLSVVVLVLAAVQWMAMALRQVALLAVAATLPLAAAGSLTAMTRGWLSRMVPAAAALVLYKPAAALVHAVGRQYLERTIGPEGAAVPTVLAGIVVLALAVATLPLSLRLLTRTSVRIATGGVSADAMAGAVGAVRTTSRTGASPSVRLAAYMESAGPGSAARQVRAPRPAPVVTPGTTAAPSAPGGVAGTTSAGPPAPRGVAGTTSAAPSTPRGTVRPPRASGTPAAPTYRPPADRPVAVAGEAPPGRQLSEHPRERHRGASR